MNDIKENKVSALIKELRGSDEKKILEAIKKVKKDGSCDTVPALISLVNPVNSPSIQKEAFSVLSELKDTASAPVILEVLLESSNEELNAKILNSMWNSSLDYSEYLAPIVKVGLSSGFMGVFEALTIIENVKGPFIEEDLLEAMLLINDGNIENRSIEERTMISSMLQQITSYSNVV